MGRVLILGSPDLEWLMTVAAEAEQVVVLLPEAERDQLAELRQRFRDREHVMIAAADPPVIPWVGQFFTEVWALPAWPEAEVRRVSTPDARRTPLPASDGM